MHISIFFSLTEEFGKTSKLQCLYNNTCDIIESTRATNQLRFLDAAGQDELGGVVLKRMNMYNPFAEGWGQIFIPTRAGNGWTKYLASDLLDPAIRAQLEVSKCFST